LQYWLTAAVYTVFGVSSATARLVTLVAGFACASWIGFVGWRLYGARSGLYSALVCGSGLLFLGAGHYITLDMMLTLWLSVGLGSLMLAQHAATASSAQRYMLLAWAALALGVLTKGLVALLLPAASLVLYTLWQRDWALWRRLYLGRGLLLMFAIAAPWFVVVSIRNPEFAPFFFIHEHFARYTTDVHDRDEPWFFIGTVFLLGSAPWLASTVLALIKPDFASTTEQAAKGFNAARLAWVYTIFTLVFFSLSHSQLASYVLPVMPFAALLVARRIEQRSLFPDAVFAALLGLVLLAVAAATPYAIAHYLQNVGQQELLLDYRPYLAFAGIALLAGAALLAGWREQRLVAVTAMALATTVAAQSLLVGFQSMAPARSERQIADRLQAMALPQDTPLYLVGFHAPSLSFYLQRVPVVAAYYGELRMGLGVEPEKALPVARDFLQRWNAQPGAVAVVSNRDLASFGDQLVYRVVYRGLHSTIISRN
jgi:4-amino-4-deoxy-L-arabinose transferase-like glycosyltransferase